MIFKHKPYAPKTSFVFTDSYWISFSSCEWFWSDEFLGFIK